MFIDDDDYGPVAERGSVFESRTADLPPGVKKLIVPEEVALEMSGKPGKLTIHLEKQFNFLGHPPHPMPLDEARKYMGLAGKVDAEVLTLGTFGEFSTFEGGVSIRIVLIVPDSLEVTRSQGLTGQESRANGSRTPSAAQLERCYWYGSCAPAAGFSSIPTEVDPGKPVTKAMTPAESAAKVIEGRPDLHRRLAVAFWAMRGCLPPHKGVAEGVNNLIEVVNEFGDAYLNEQCLRLREQLHDPQNIREMLMEFLGLLPPELQLASSGYVETEQSQDSDDPYGLF